jgi:hypothetical protein
VASEPDVVRGVVIVRVWTEHEALVFKVLLAREHDERAGTVGYFTSPEAATDAVGAALAALATTELP